MQRVKSAPTDVSEIKPKRAAPRKMTEAQSISLTDYLRGISEDGHIDFTAERLTEIASAHIGTEVAKSTVVRRCKVLGLETVKIRQPQLKMTDLEARLTNVESTLQTLVDQLGGCPGVTDD